MDYLSCLTTKFSLSGLSESWLTPGSGFVNIPGSNFINQDRKGKSGGGVALYLDENLEFKIRANLNIMTDVLEALFVEIFNPHGKNVIAGAMYRPPNNLDFQCPSKIHQNQNETLQTFFTETQFTKE